MKKTPWIIAAAATCALAVGGGSTAYAMSNEVEVDHYGRESVVRTFSPTVRELLESEGIIIKDTDLVTPDLDTVVGDGTEIRIVERRPVTVSIDGEKKDVLTTGTTVQDALDELGVNLKDATISPEPSTALEARDNQVQVVTRKTVTFKGQYGQDTFQVNALTVDEAMKKVLGDIQDTDTASVPRDSILEDGAVITVQRVRLKERTETQELPFETKTEKSGDLAKGESRTKTEGKKGAKQKVIQEKIVDGKVVETKVVSEKVTSQPVAKVVIEGAKPTPARDRASGESSRGGERGGPATDQGGAGVGAVRTCGASHYGQGDGTHGGPTASGERFNKYAMTAAHKTLPLGTRVRVTNPSNGKSVVVRINDRGPYIGGRCLDLSYGAFSRIADPGRGVMTVKWQRVG